jgi:hypothetical protein
MQYTKQQIYKITSRLYKELRTNYQDIVLKKIYGKHGEYDYETDEVSLDYRKDLLSTLIHEYLHKWHPDKCETWVLNHERLIVNALSIAQIKRIIYEFAQAICKT